MFRFCRIHKLTDGIIDLVISEKKSANLDKDYVPSYVYNIRLHDSNFDIGKIDIRIGFNRNTFYGGNIGYEIFKKYRGNGYAAKACKLIFEVGLYHEMNSLIITCNPDNIPSKKTCENIGGKLLEIVDLPTNNELYIDGERKKCRFEIILKKEEN